MPLLPGAAHAPRTPVHPFVDAVDAVDDVDDVDDAPFPDLDPPAPSKGRSFVNVFLSLIHI